MACSACRPELTTTVAYDRLRGGCGSTRGEPYVKRLVQWMLGARRSGTTVRSLIILFLIFVLIGTVFLILLSRQFSHYALSEIDRYSENHLAQTRRSLEAYFEKIKAFGLAIHNSPDIYHAITAESLDPYQEFLALHQLLVLTSLESTIRSVYLINLPRGTVLTSDDGKYRVSDFPDQTMLQIVRERPQPTLQFFYHEVRGAGRIALVIPSVPARINFRGYVVLLLDPRAVEASFLGGVGEAGMSMLLLDEQHRTIVGRIGELLMPQLPSAPSDASVGHRRVSAGGQSFLVTSVSLTSYGWTLHQAWPLQSLTEGFDRSQLKIIVVSIVILCALFIVTLLKFLAAFRPFARLAADMQRSVGPQAAPGSLFNPELKDYSVIKRGIDLLIGDQQELVKDDCLRQWILAGNLHPTEIDRIRQDSDILSFTELRLGVLRIESADRFPSELDFSGRREYRRRLGALVEGMERKRLTVECVDLRGNHLVMLIGAGAAEEEELLDILARLRDEIVSSLGLKVAIAISDRVSANENLKHVYDFVHELTFLRFITGEERIYRAKDYHELLDGHPQYPEDDLSHDIMQAIRANEAGRVQDLLERFKESLRLLSYAECRSTLVLGAYNVLKTFGQMAGGFTFNGIAAVVDRSQTLDEVFLWLAEEIQAISAWLRSSRTEQKREELVLEITEYVKDHLSRAALNVEEIADHLLLSSDHVRKLFKKTSGISLSDYILKERIRAVRRLLESSAWSLAEIAERAGFQTRSHFFDAFKRETGMTPSGYRHQVLLQQRTGSLRSEAGQ